MTDRIYPATLTKHVHHYIHDDAHMASTPDEPRLLGLDPDLREHTSCPKCDVNFPCMNDRPNCQRGFADPGSYFGEHGRPLYHVRQTIAHTISAVAGAMPVTLQMQAAGLLEIYREATDGDRVHAIYRAMKALEPVELVSTGELAAMKERDDYKRQRDRLLDEAALGVRELCALRDEIAALTAENNGLRDRLALSIAQTPPIPDPPKPAILNAIKSRDMDRRKVGGM